jgi:hypothetical protein
MDSLGFLYKICPQNYLPADPPALHASPLDAKVHSDLRPGQEEKNNMGEFGQGNGNEQNFTQYNVRKEPELIT